MLLLAGTKKGLFLFTSPDRERWAIRGPYVKGRQIHHTVRDERTGRIFAASNDAWFGSEIVYSDDLGDTWISAKRSPAFTEASGLKLEAIWHIEPGRKEEPKVLYAGVAPAALFRSDDGGETWNEVSGLSEHPTRDRWHPGAGGLCLHSIQLDPSNPRRIYVGISAVGVFRTDDAGQSWKTVNRGTRAEFMPNNRPEFGQCVHKLLLAPGAPETLFQQNHCGVYRSADAGEHWDEITGGLPSDFGFPLAVHPRDPATIYVLPLQGAEFRCTPDGKFRVFRTRDAGQTWEGLTNGLPQENAYAGVLREGMAADACDPAGIYLGTNTGRIFASRDEGDSWQLIAGDLPPISSISVSVT